MGALDATAAGPDAKVRYGLEIEVDKSIGKAVNIRYTYGDEFVNQARPSAIAIGAFVSYIAPMRIPENLEISWETPDGKRHEESVPVRSRLTSSVEGKTIVFVIMQDHIEGYIGVWTPYGQKRERFY
jgi:hypothetical protein